MLCSMFAINNYFVVVLFCFCYVQFYYTIVVFRISGKKNFGRYKGSSWTVKNEFGYKVERKVKDIYSRLI